MTGDFAMSKTIHGHAPGYVVSVELTEDFCRWLGLPFDSVEGAEAVLTVHYTYDPPEPAHGMDPPEDDCMYCYDVDLVSVTAWVDEEAESMVFHPGDLPKMWEVLKGHLLGCYVLGNENAEEHCRKHLAGRGA